MRSVIALVCLSVLGLAQSGFGTQRAITTTADGAWSVYATDLDGDGDADVLSASEIDDKIAWYENLGGGTFGPQRVITTSADGARSVYATDLDGDGDADVLSASIFDDKIAWYENLGGGAFGPQQAITSSADGPFDVYATDLDGDGDADVLSASSSDDKIAWYENLGGGTFGPQRVITISADGARSVYATDLDGDGDADVLSAFGYGPLTSDAIAWYENLGGGAFGPQQVITTSAQSARSVYATDLDGDGDADVLAVTATIIFAQTVWYENLGGGAFGPEQAITTNATAAQSVYATDLDGDGDADVLSASSPVAWYENLGGGAFGPQQGITTAASGARSAYATDLDGDGDADVLSASFWDDKIAWYENLLPRAPSIGATQASPGAPVYVNNANLTPGNEYYNIFSTTPCPGAVGSGPYLGLCAASLGDFLAQVSLPIGAAPFHIIAPSSHVNWGPYTLPPVIVDAVCFDYTGGVLGPVSPVFRITVQ